MINDIEFNKEVKMIIVLINGYTFSIQVTFPNVRSARMGSGPDPNNIVLILRTQSILFDRYSAELQPYKYAGYPMLIKTIKLESEDSELFSKVVYD